jgi:hypothetical protein
MYKVEEKIYLGVSKSKTLIITDLECKKREPYTRGGKKTVKKKKRKLKTKRIIPCNRKA